MTRKKWQIWITFRRFARGIQDQARVPTLLRRHVRRRWV